MAEIVDKEIDAFWLFHDVEDQEILELRKFIDPELDLKYLEGIVDVFDKINDFFK